MSKRDWKDMRNLVINDLGQRPGKVHPEKVTAENGGRLEVVLEVKNVPGNGHILLKRPVLEIAGSDPFAWRLETEADHQKDKREKINLSIHHLENLEDVLQVEKMIVLLAAISRKAIVQKAIFVISGTLQDADPSSMDLVRQGQNVISFMIPL